jgi:hypothetical protein
MVSWPFGSGVRWQGWSLGSLACRDVGYLLSVRAGELDSSRASRCKNTPKTRAKLDRIGLTFVPRAFLRIFHRDGPDSSHCSWLGFSSPCF